MKKLFLDKTINFLKKYKDYSDEELEKLRYGLEGIYLTITKLVFIILGAILLDMIKELCVLLILFNIIRYTGFGFHAEKSWHCLLFSLSCFVILPKLFLSINFDTLSVLIIGICSIIIFLLFAPADTVKRPLPNKKKRIIRKISTVLIACIYLGLSLIFKDLWVQRMLLCSLIIEDILVLPLTYLIFKQPFNNYKNYTKA